MVKFYKHDPSVKDPQRGTSLSSGIDFFSPIDTLIEAGKDVLIDLQISVLLPPEYELQMENKSGVSTKLKLLRGATIIDADYTYPNKIHAHLFNLGNEDVRISKDQKIIHKVELWPVEIETDAEKMKREGERQGGFSSTGMF